MAWIVVVAFPIILTFTPRDCDHLTLVGASIADVRSTVCYIVGYTCAVIITASWIIESFTRTIYTCHRFVVRARWAIILALAKIRPGANIITATCAGYVITNRDFARATFWTLRSGPYSSSIPPASIWTSCLSRSMNSERLRA